MRFKVGDKVRYVSEIEEGTFLDDYNTFTVIATNKIGFQLEEDLDENNIWFWDRGNFELVEEPKNKWIKYEYKEPLKNNANKPQIGLVRPQFIKGVSQVLTYGATKYNEPRGDEPNYMRGEGFHYSEIYDSLQRHLNTWYSGESFDEETKLNHLLHAASNIMFLYMYEISDRGIDDRIIIKEKR